MEELRKECHNNPTLILHATACVAKASEVISTLEGLRRTYREPSSLRQCAFQACIILKTCFLIPVALYSLSSINCSRCKVTLLVYHHYFSSLFPFLFNLIRKKNNQDRFLAPPFLYFLWETQVFVHAEMRSPPPGSAYTAMASQWEPTGLAQRAPRDLCCCCTSGCTGCRLQGLRVDVTGIVKEISFVGRFQWGCLFYCLLWSLITITCN